MPLKFALIGDFSANVTAHRAIPLALKLEAAALSVDIEIDWLATDELNRPGILSDYNAGWAVPASPYLGMGNAISAIRFLRENNIPFLGTCAGYQHALVEYARNVLGHALAGITEVDTECAMPLVSELICALIEQDEPVFPAPGSNLAVLTGTNPLQETYMCSFGINPDYAHIFDGSDFKVAARDAQSAVRAMELQEHPFFLGTAFQPERVALAGRRHPIISGFVSAAQNAAAN